MKPMMISIPVTEQKWLAKKLRHAVIPSVQGYIYTLLKKERQKEERKANNIKKKKEKTI